MTTITTMHVEGGIQTASATGPVIVTIPIVPDPLHESRVVIHGATLQDLLDALIVGLEETEYVRCDGCREFYPAADLPLRKSYDGDERVCESCIEAADFRRYR